MAAATSAMTLTGCCSLRLPMPMPPVLSPDGLCIDPHCHIFNGQDLDIFNYKAGDMPWYAALTLPVLYSLTEFIRAVAPTAEEELAKLRRHASLRAEPLKGAASPADLQRVNDAFRLETRKFIDHLEFEKSAERQQVLAAPTLAEAVVRAQTKITTSRNKRGRGARNEKEAAREQVAFKHLPEAMDKLRNSPGVYAFFESFFHYRIVNAQRMETVYPMMALFTPAMMDTDSWFQNRFYQPLDPSTPLAPQLELYEQIAILTNGRCLPLLAFDPRRQVEWRAHNPAAPKSPMDLVTDGVARGCLLGVKLYPPMGYRPANNIERDATPDADWHAGLGAEMDKELASLFAWAAAADRQLPLMAHNNKSHGSDKKYISNAKPENWRLALNQAPKLKVNLAHFGGITNDSGWRAGICDLMKDFDGVYTDIGDFLELSKQDKFLDDLKAFLGKTPVISRLMYGSDFFMNGLVPGYKDYAEQWVAGFQRHFPADWPKLVGSNAADFLGLHPNQPARQRLDGFIQKNQLTPDWVRLVGPA